MSGLSLLPEHLRKQSISADEIVLPMAAALDAIDVLETTGVLILGWEGWVRDMRGRVGHGSAPQGTTSLEHLSVGGRRSFAEKRFGLTPRSGRLNTRTPPMNCTSASLSMPNTSSNADAH